MNEVIAVFHSTRRVRDENANARVGLRENESLDNLEEFRIVVDSRLQVMSKNRNLASGLACDFDSRLPHFLTRRDDPAFSLLPCLFHS